MICPWAADSPLYNFSENNALNRRSFSRTDDIAGHRAARSV